MAGRTYLAIMNAPENPKLCPICDKPSRHAFRPFCSRRCADVDLHYWLTGKYIVPGNESDEEDEPSIIPSPSAGRP
jgi:endogenous inhibitor of DNA gyrase (YacG/DUF329 family)